MLSYRSHLAWATVSAFYAYQYILRVFPNIALSEILQRFQIDVSLLGQFSGSYYVGYALIHLPVAILLDRWGPRLVLPCFILVTTIGLIPLMASRVWFYALLGRVLMGAGSSAAILGIFKITQLAFPARKFSRMLGFSVAIGVVGALYGGAPLKALLVALGFENVIVILLVVGFLLSLIVAISLPSHQGTREKYALCSALQTVISNRQFLALCGLAGLMVGPLEGYADVWATSFLKEIYGLEDNLASSLPSLIFLGFCIGGPLLSLFAERTKSHMKIIAVCAFIMAGSFLALMTGRLNVEWLFILFFLIGLCCAYQILAISLASTYVDVKYAGLATTIANMIIMAFGYLFHSVIGYIMSMYGGKLLHASFYSGQAMLWSLSIIPATLLLSGGGLLYFIYQQDLMREKPREQSQIISLS